MNQKLNIVVLAAGKGTRLGVDYPKPLLPFCEKTLIDQILNQVEKLKTSLGFQTCLSIVVGHQALKVQSYIQSRYQELNIEFILQKEQLGTGHAIQQFLAQTQFEADEVMILCADTPLITHTSLCDLSSFKSSKNLKAAGLSFNAGNPFGYGRIIRDSKKIGISIIEEKDATDTQRKIPEVNSGIYLIDKKYLIEKTSKLESNNKSNEFYLTDVMDMNERCDFISVNDGEKIFLGVNTMVQLSQAEKHMRIAINLKHLENGVRIIDPDTTHIGEDVVISPGVAIYPNVHLRGQTIIKENAIIETGAVISNSTIKALVTILPYSVIDDSVIEAESAIGPFARIRPGSNIGEKCKIGNFVETKKVNLSSGVKISHLSYVGDAEVGEGSNIGCGFITCNYDGKEKHTTKIGKNCFIGSDSQTIAPVNIGDNCYVASGSTINKDLSDGDFAISRGRQVVKEGLAKKFIKK